MRTSFVWCQVAYGGVVGWFACVSVLYLFVGVFGYFVWYCGWLMLLCVSVTSVCPSGLRGYVQVVMFSNAWVQIPQLTLSHGRLERRAFTLFSLDAMKW